MNDDTKKKYESLDIDLKKAVDFCIELYFQKVNPDISKISRFYKISSKYIDQLNPISRTGVAKQVRADFQKRDLSRDGVLKIFTNAALVIKERGGFKSLDNHLADFLKKDDGYIPLEQREGVNKKLAKYCEEVQRALSLVMVLPLTKQKYSEHPAKELLESNRNDNVTQVVYHAAVQNLFWPEYGLANVERSEYDSTIQGKLMLNKTRVPPKKRDAIIKGEITDVDRVFDIFGSIIKRALESLKGHSEYEGLMPTILGKLIFK